MERLAQSKIPVNTKIPLRCAEASQKISRDISLTGRISRSGINRRIRECGRIERFPARDL